MYIKLRVSTSIGHGKYSTDIILYHISENVTEEQDSDSTRMMWLPVLKQQWHVTRSSHMMMRCLCHSQWQF